MSEILRHRSGWRSERQLLVHGGVPGDESSETRLAVEHDRELFNERTWLLLVLELKRCSLGWSSVLDDQLAFPARWGVECETPARTPAVWCRNKFVAHPLPVPAGRDELGIGRDEDAEVILIRVIWPDPIASVLTANREFILPDSRSSHQREHNVLPHVQAALVPTKVCVDDGQRRW